MKYSNIDQLLHDVNEQPEYRGFMGKFPKRTFVSVQCWPQLQKAIKGVLVFWLHTPPLVNSPLTVKHTTSFTLMYGVLHHISSDDSLNVGYVIELPPNLHHELVPTYISSTPARSLKPLQTITDLPTLDHIFHNKHISVMCCGNQQLIGSMDMNLVDFLSN